jgi:hypothetical protein
MRTGRFQDCLEDAQQARVILETLEPSDQVLLSLANACQNAGAALTDLGRPRDAAAELRRSAETFERLSPSMRARPPVRLDLAACRIGLAVTAFNNKQAAEADAHLRQALDMLERLAVEFPEDALVQNKLAFARRLRQQIR